MKLETLLLRGLFVACMTVCGLILGAMLTLQPPSVRLAGDNVMVPVVGSALRVPGNRCAMPPDGVVCPRQLG